MLPNTLCHLRKFHAAKIGWQGGTKSRDYQMLESIGDIHEIQLILLIDILHLHSIQIVVTDLLQKYPTICKMIIIIFKKM